MSKLKNNIILIGPMGSGKSSIGKKLSNVQLADKVGLKVEISEATRAQQDGLAGYEIYLLSTTVSRKKKLAQTAIANAAKGIFP